MQIIKRDKLGRKRHPNQAKGRNKLYYHTISVRLDKESYDDLKKKSKGSLGAKIREYIEWGLENDE